jgi:hypothetical protein
MNAIVAAVTDDRFADILFCLLGVSHRAKCELIQRVKQPMMSSAGPGAARALSGEVGTGSPQKAGQTQGI